MSRAEGLLRSRWLLPWLLVLAAGISVWRGQDAAWDLKNYHLYNAWAFLHGRLDIDLAPASLQSYFNPLPDLPYFWLGSGMLAHAPRLLAAVQGLWYGGLVFILCRIVRRFAEQGRRSMQWTDIGVVFIGATGTMTLSQAGVSTNEVPLALLVLGGYLIAMPAAVRVKGGAARALIAGLVCGLAAGLKPTAVVYAPALGFSLWAAHGFRQRGLILMLMLGAASAVGFVVAYGAWGYMLWRLTGNPIFPMFNQVFHSTWMPLTGSTDRQFMPRSVLQALFYPFWWLQKNSTQGGNRFADARYALAMIALLASAAIAMVSRVDRTSHPARRMLFAFLSCAYVLWLTLYSILRYAVPIEAMTGLAMLAAAQLAAERFGRARPRIIPISMAACLVVILATTHYTDWGHAPYADSSFAVAPPAVPDDSLIIILSSPNAYVVPFIPNIDSARVVSLTWLNIVGAGHGFADRVASAIRTQHGPAFVILRDDADRERAQLAELVPGYVLIDCRPIISGLEFTRRHRDDSENLRMCRLQRPG
jgi:hypothetical protein